MIAAGARRIVTISTISRAQAAIMALVSTPLIQKYDVDLLRV
jgi:hypothetical protein